MLFFNFSSFREYQARKNSAEFITIINSGFSVINKMRAELNENPDKYARLKLNPKEVTRAHLIVVNENVYTLRKVTTERANWELQPVKNVNDVMRSLEQKARLIQAVTRQMERGEIPTEKPRAYVARLIKGA